MSQKAKVTITHFRDQNSLVALSLEPFHNRNGDKRDQNIRNKNKAVLWRWHVIRIKWRHKEEKGNWYRKKNRQQAGDEAIKQGNDDGVEDKKGHWNIALQEVMQAIPYAKSDKNSKYCEKIGLNAGMGPPFRILNLHK